MPMQVPAAPAESAEHGLGSHNPAPQRRFVQVSGLLQVLWFRPASNLVHQPVCLQHLAHRWHIHTPSMQPADLAKPPFNDVWRCRGKEIEGITYWPTPMAWICDMLEAFTLLGMSGPSCAHPCLWSLAPKAGLADPEALRSAERRTEAGIVRVCLMLSSPGP